MGNEMLAAQVQEMINQPDFLDILKILKVFTSIILAFVTITILIVIIINLIKLSNTSNPQKVEAAKSKLNVNFISLAVIGGMDIVMLLISKLM